ncbi:MAG: alpha/beta hydrolase family protein [Chitinispirillaceae bacterium]
MKKRILALFTLLLLHCTGATGQTHPSVSLLDKSYYKSFSRIARSPLNRMPKRKAWETAVPQAQRITITSSADGKKQPALFYDSKSKHKKPLLVALHSWNSDYEKQFSIPFGVWAVKNDWVFIHPDYRGPYTNSKSTASELAIQDILDALEYAKSTANVDESRIYITGFSGGGMTTLIMAGRYPELWTAAAAWVPVYDLTQWYETTRNSRHGYARHIENSCGGAPTPGTEAYKECKKRSVSRYLQNAKGEKIQIYIATGVKDVFVPPGHSLQAFNDLAREKDKFTTEEITYINKNLQLPDHLQGTYPDSLFRDAGYEQVYERQSSNAIIKLYDGNHDIIFNAGLVWLSRQKK